MQIELYTHYERPYIQSELVTLYGHKTDISKNTDFYKKKTGKI